MKEAERAQALFEAFADGFLGPLLEGREVQLTRMLGPGLLTHFTFAQTAESEVDAAIYERLHALASRHAPVRALTYPSRETRAFAMALHDLIALTDPLLDRLFARRARPRVVAFVRGLLAETSAPRTRGEVLARHVICDRALALERRDIVVTNWAYTYRFFGRPVPRNVVAMPRLRRVKQREQKHSLLELFSELDSEALPLNSLLEAVLARSPFTRLTHFSLSHAPLFDLATLAMLEDASLRQGLIAELGPMDEAVVMTRLGIELWKLRLWAHAPARLLSAASTFVLEMGLSLLLRREPPKLTGTNASFELGLALSLPAAAQRTQRLWPVLSKIDDERATDGARKWAEWASDVPLKEAENILSLASAGADLERAS